MERFEGDDVLDFGHAPSSRARAGGLAHAAGRDAAAGGFAVVARGAVHVGGEGARRDGTDHDLLADQLQRHAFGQVDQPGLAGRVGVGFQHVHRQPVDGRDVDDLGWARPDWVKITLCILLTYRYVLMDRQESRIFIQHFPPFLFYGPLPSAISQAITPIPTNV